MAREIDFAPEHIPPQAWEDAYRKVDAYLAALGTRRIVLRQGLTREFMAVVRAKFAEGGRTPAEIAMDELEEKLLTWMRRIFSLTEIDNWEAIWRGHLALLLAAKAGRHYNLLIPEEFWPPQPVKAIAVVPEFCPGTMKRHPLDLGVIPRLMEAFLNTVAQNRWFLILVWGAIMASFSLLFYYWW